MQLWICTFYVIDLREKCFFFFAKVNISSEAIFIFFIFFALAMNKKIAKWPSIFSNLDKYNTCLSFCKLCKASTTFILGT